MNTPEFSRPIDIRQASGRELKLEASADERKALSSRFNLVRIDQLEANVSLDRKDRMAEATGRLVATFVQSCAVSAEDLPVSIDEELFFRFVPADEDHKPDEEIEIDANACDEIEYHGTSFDIGEALAQSLGLAIDPYAVGPEAEATRERAGIGTPDENGPFAALKGLKLDE
ncbi:MAG: YceD family protein [Novosphingobium sp.]|nr:YceD family protein [Novosphingobium sp.]